MIESFDENCLVANCLKMETRFRPRDKRAFRAAVAEAKKELRRWEGDGLPNS